MHYSIVFSAIVAFVVVVMSLYMTENYASLGPPDLNSTYLQALFALSVALITLLAVIVLYRMYNRDLRVASFFVLFWIFAMIMSVSDLALITNLNNLSLVIEDGKLRGSNGLAIIISSSITLVMLVFSWLIPLEYQNRWIISTDNQGR